MTRPLPFFAQKTAGGLTLLRFRVSVLLFPHHDDADDRRHGDDAQQHPQPCEPRALLRNGGAVLCAGLAVGRVRQVVHGDGALVDAGVLCAAGAARGTGGVAGSAGVVHVHGARAGAGGGAGAAVVGFVVGGLIVIGLAVVRLAVIGLAVARRVAAVDVAVVVHRDAGGEGPLLHGGDGVRQVHRFHVVIVRERALGDGVHRDTGDAGRYGDCGVLAEIAGDGDGLVRDGVVQRTLGVDGGSQRRGRHGQRHEQRQQYGDEFFHKSLLCFAHRGIVRADYAPVLG